MATLTAAGAYGWERDPGMALLWFVLGFWFCVAPLVVWQRARGLWLRRIALGALMFVMPLQPAGIVLFGWTGLAVPEPVPALAALVVYAVPAMLAMHANIVAASGDTARHRERG